MEENLNNSIEEMATQEETESFKVTPTEDGDDLDQEINDLEETLEDELAQEGEMDLTCIEFGDDGLPRITEEDMNKIEIVMGYSGLQGAQIKDEIYMLQKQALDQFEQKAIFDNPDTPAEEKEFCLYDEKVLKKAIEALAAFQKMARSEETKMLTSEQATTMFEHSVAFTTFLTSLYREYISDKNRIGMFGDLDKTIEEFLGENNYYTIFFRMINKEVELTDKTKIFELMTHTETVELVSNKFSTLYKELFNYIGSRYVYNAGTFSNKNIMNILSSLLDYVHNMIFLAVVEDNEIAERYFETAYEDGERTEEMKAAFMQKLRDEFNNSIFYYEMNNSEEGVQIVQKAIEFTKRVFDITDKICNSDVDHKASLTQIFTMQLDDLRSELKSIYTTYKVDNIEDLAEQIMTEVSKNDMPEKIRNKMKDMIEKRKAELEKQAQEQNENQDQINDEETEKAEPTITIDDNEDLARELDEMEKDEDLPKTAQVERDHYTPRHYPILEKAKTYFRFESILMNAIVSVYHNKKFVYQLVIGLLSTAASSKLFDTLFKYSVMNIGKNDFYNQKIPFDMPLKEIAEKKSELDKEYSGGDMSSQFQRVLIASNLSDLNTAISITESAKNNEEMMDTLYELYNTHKDALPEFRIACIHYMYKKNDVTKLRKDIYYLASDIYSKLLDGLELLNDSKFVGAQSLKYFDEKQHLYAVKQNRLQRLKAKRKKRK